MDLALVIKSRLDELGLEQKDLAAFAQVTESYISQLLGRKKMPPSAARTAIYARISRFLKLPEDELSRLADVQRVEKLKTVLREQMRPLYPQCREAILAKCARGSRKEVGVIFERESYGELERLVTQKLVDVVRAVVKDELTDEERLGVLAELCGRSIKQVRRDRRELLKSDPFAIREAVCATFVKTLIESWDIDLKSFRLDVALNRKLLAGRRMHFEFMEIRHTDEIEPGLKEFLADQSLSADITEEEVAFLKGLRFGNRQPTCIYFHRELQNLRDPLNFRPRPGLSVTRKSGG